MHKNNEEREETMNNNPRSSAAVAFLIGAVAGGITALLLAPQTGAHTRRRLRRGAESLYRRGEGLAQDLEGTVAEKTDAITGAIRGAVSETKHTYRDELDKRRAPAGTEMK